MYIYLDQNVMITLAGAMNGSERCKEYEGLAHRVMELADTDNARFPASLSHVMETQKLPPHRREPVRRFISDLAKGAAIAPVYRQEGEMFVNNLLRKKTDDFTELVLIHPENEFHDLKKITESEFEIRKMISLYFSAKEFDMRIFSGVTDKSATKFLERANTYSTGFLEEFNGRKEKQGLASLRKALLATKLNGAISYPLQNLSISERARLKRVLKNKDPEELITQLPSYQVEFLLEYERLKSGALQRNDYSDILALSTAMPYCDAVVFEKTFTNIARAAKVPGKIFSTAKKMREFEEFLDSI